MNSSALGAFSIICAPVLCFFFALVSAKKRWRPPSGGSIMAIQHHVLKGRPNDSKHVLPSLSSRDNAFQSILSKELKESNFARSQVYIVY